MLPTRLLLLPLILMVPGGARAQGVIDWPVRAAPQPEAILTGAASVFWNPASLAGAMGTRQELWITHVDGPDATGVQGVALAGSLDLPLGVRAGLGYIHLRIPDIPRTTDSPLPQPGDIQVSEDVFTLGLTRNLPGPGSMGGSLRLIRGHGPGQTRTRVVSDIGLHLRPRIPTDPRIGLALRGVAEDISLLGGLEVSLPALAEARLPLWIGYGMETRRDFAALEHRLSVRGSWRDVLRFGVGARDWETGEGWTPIWMVGGNFGRYSVSVLREGLADGVGPVHFFRLAIGLW